MDGKPEACGPHDLTEPPPDCPTCAHIIEFCTSSKEKAVLVLGSYSSLTDTKCSHREWLTSFIPARLIAEGPLELSLSMHGSSIEVQCKGSDRWSPTYRNELVYQQETRRGRGRILDSSWIDERVVLEWKDLCSQHHGEACENPLFLERAEPVQPTWLIDTTDGCLVPGDRGMRYVALSYVRGGAVAHFHHEKCNTDQLQIPGVLLHGDLANLLPATVKDAIAVVPLLGERFLWVDSLCMVHDDRALLQTELNAMSRIFKSSYFTIVAVDGTDANYGLRGFKGRTSPRKVQQRVVSLAGREIMIASVRSRGSDKARGVYHSRAWTYQEYLFAKRRLVFEGEMIFWECELCHWDEELIPDVSSTTKTYNPWSRGDYFKSIGLFMKISMPDMISISPIISEFNQQILESAHDALAAFSGIQWMLGQAFPGGLLYGIPECFFEAGLMWIPSGIVERRHSTTRSGLESQLPSWSFLGWQGDVKFILDAEFRAHPGYQDDFIIGISRPITTWYTTSHPLSSERRQIRSTWHDCKIQGRKVARELPEVAPQYPWPPDELWGRFPPKMDHSEEMKIRMQKFRDLSAKIPKGWDLDRLAYGGGCNPPGHSMAYSELDEGVQEYAYRHESDDVRQELIDHPMSGHYSTYYRYPVPVQPEATLDTPPLPTQFLFCKTSRAFLRGIAKTPTNEASTNGLLYCDGENVGFVRLMSQNHEGLHVEDTEAVDAPFELVAISEGWACWDDGPDKDRNIRIRQRTERRQCYHVLCIGWEENVAYRRGVGCVLKSTWEEMREEEPVDLILG